MYQLHSGVITRGFQFASGEAVGRGSSPSPFSAGTLELQRPHFVQRGFDLEHEVPNLIWGTINIELPYKLVIAQADVTLENIDWTRPHDAHLVLPAETFSFVRCCLAYDGRYYEGLVYYPHPETKLATNRHNYDVLEVITRRVEGLRTGALASVICRASTFAPIG